MKVIEGLQSIFLTDAYYENKIFKLNLSLEELWNSNLLGKLINEPSEDFQEWLLSLELTHTMQIPDNLAGIKSYPIMRKFYYRKSTRLIKMRFRTKLFKASK
ncbi:unnamed protein product [Blepharisma stoltei]|uniref:Uncharacterized protein n=1 Tax=Blepharisma stoltei TaxID=1481888 RepID=A0AAU9J960_9CILI|nr:unnamed protein product [Blepharisma stoltei]